MTKDPYETYLGLRRLALDMTAEQLGLAGLAPQAAYGAVMELAIGDGTATLVCFVTGETSLYLSSGGGVTGAGVHENVREACRAFVETCAKAVSRMKRASTEELPSAGMVVFYALTPSGPFTEDDKEELVRDEQSALSELGQAGQAVITELRQFMDRKPALN